MEIKFKFQYLQNSDALFLPEKGVANDSGINLGKHSLDYDNIADVEAFENQLTITVSKPSYLDDRLIIHITDGSVLALDMWDPLESTCRHASLSIL